MFDWFDEKDKLSCYLSQQKYLIIEIVSVLNNSDWISWNFPRPSYKIFFIGSIMGLSSLLGSIIYSVLYSMLSIPQSFTLMFHRAVSCHFWDCLLYFCLRWTVTQVVLCPSSLSNFLLCFKCFIHLILICFIYIHMYIYIYCYPCTNKHVSFLPRLRSPSACTHCTTRQISWWL